MAMNLYLIRLDGTYARYTGVVSDPVFVNMTGKGEPYRDIPAVNTTLSYAVATQLGLPRQFVETASNTGITVSNPDFVLEPTGPTTNQAVGFTGTLGTVEPDDVSHEPPRQGDQQYTFWKFDFGVSAGNPQYSYAEFRRGDIISNTAPNTDPTV